MSEMSWKMFISLIFFISWSYGSAEECLGIDGACELTLDEVTLVGAHNSGAGFYRDLFTGFFSSILNCFYQNQDKSISDMLNAGVRFFDIDLCMKRNELWTCHDSYYGGPMKEFFKQVHDWTLVNPKEIVVLNCNGNYEGDPGIIGPAAIAMLRDLWEPTSASIGSNKLTMQTDVDVKIGVAVERNQRIYVFMHPNLRKTEETFLLKTEDIGTTFKNFALYPKAHAKLVGKLCFAAATKKFVHADLYYTGVCIKSTAKQYPKSYKIGVDTCLAKIQQNAMKVATTVNFIVTDYSDIGAPIATQIAKDLIEVQIAMKNLN